MKQNETKQTVPVSGIRAWLTKYFLLIYYAFIAALYFLARDPGKKLDETSIFFSVVVFGVCGALALAKISPVRLFGLSADNLFWKMLLYILPMFLFTNAYLIYLQKALGESPAVKSFTVVALLKVLFPFAHVAKFGEELVFRGFLLSRTVSANKKLWWSANVAQAVVFAGIHALVPMPLGTRIVFVAFVVALGLIYGLLNRKFQSLLPSAILHGTNGLVMNLMGFF